MIALVTYPATLISSIFYSESSASSTLGDSGIIDSAKPSAPINADSLEPNYGWKEDVVPVSAGTSRGIDKEKEKELDSIISLLVERVKNVENANLAQNVSFIDFLSLLWFISTTILFVSLLGRFDSHKKRTKRLRNADREQRRIEKALRREFLSDNNSLHWFRRLIF